MFKLLTSVPLVVLACVFLLRSMSAPAPSKAGSSGSVAPELTQEPQEPEPASEYLAFARLSFEEGVRPIVNARAVAIFKSAQKSGNAATWIDKYCRKVAGDVGALRTRYGTVSGDARQANEYLNRTAELSACAAAQDWILNGLPSGIQASVSPQSILRSYGETYGKQK